MSRLCAKPTCSERAVSWLDIARHNQTVVEHLHEVTAAIALCADHRARFALPAGWTIESADLAGPNNAEPEAPVISATQTVDLAGVGGPKATSSRARPWFLAGTPEPTAEPVRPLLPEVADGRAYDESLTAGSLLRRAFHGPDRGDDIQRREDDAMAEESPEQNELETRRSRRSLDEYGTAELPFPPLDTEPRAAVS